MKSRDFVYWLQGFIELQRAANNATPPSGEQWNVIRNHLALVFKHEIDPEAGDVRMQEALNQIHSGKPPTGVMQGIPGASDILIRC